MRTVGLIPARGGSKGIKRKNLAVVAGYPLLAYPILAMHQVERITGIYVSTDDDEIAATARRYGAEVIRRPPEISDDESPTEDAITDFLKHVDCHAVAMCQCTSPYLDSIYLAEALDSFYAAGYDSMFSVVDTKYNDMLLWSTTLRPLNYRPKDRGTRQSRVDRVYIETGGFYIFKRQSFLKHNCRICGSFAVKEVPTTHLLEIDTPHDLSLARAMMEIRK